MALELWRYSRATCQTPRQALSDRDRAFNFTIMRAADKARATQFAVAMANASKGDDLGIMRVLTALALIYEDS